MKKLIYVFALLLIISACKKEDLITNASMSAKIDGNAWTSITRITIEKNGYLFITGTSFGGEVIEISVFGNKASAYELSLNSASAGCGAIYKPDASSTDSNFVSKTGKVIISKVDAENKLVSGSFNFVVTNADLTKNITEGTFTDLEYKPE